MESSSGDAGDSVEDIPGSKKSKLKSLRTRLFRKSKRTGEERHAKLSQSASDVAAAGEELGSDDDDMAACSHGVMGSRAFSHDSIFLDDEALADAEPARVSSQENVHSKIKALQMKLQQQKMHLGPPPLVLPVRRPPEDAGSHSSEVPGSDVTSQGVFSENTTQPRSPPLSPQLVAPPPSRPPPASVSAETAPDLGSPARFTACLDTSAARHRMSVKPRNQRASTKKRVGATDSRLASYAPDDADRSLSEEEPPLRVQDTDIIDAAQRRVPSPPAEASASTLSQPEAAPRSRAPPVSSQVLRVKPQRAVGVASSERPHSSFIESELRSRREAGFEVQVLSYEKRNVLKRTDDPSEKTLRPSAVPQEVQDETETTKGFKRPAPGSGSFHFSVTAARERDEARPRSSSLVGIRERAEAKHEGREDKSSSSLRDKDEGREDKSSSSLRDKDEPRGSSSAAGRLRREDAPSKGSALQWDRNRKLETNTSSADTGGSAREEKEVKRKQDEVERNQREVERSHREVKRSREEVEEAVEAREEVQEVQEEEGKMAFGVKLRATTQSRRFQRDSASNRLVKAPSEEQEVSERVDHNSTRRPPTSVSDPAPSGFSLPVKNNLPPAGHSHVVPATSSDHRETEDVLVEPPPPRAASSSEVSWMSLALEKTRTLQQLFTSRFPRDFAGASPPSTDSAKAAAAKAPQVSVTASPEGPHAPQQTPRSHRVLQQSGQPKSTTLVSTTAAPPAGGEGEGSAEEKDAPSSSDRRAARGGSVSKMAAAFLERRAERTTVVKEALEESPASAKASPLSTDAKPEGRPAPKPAESTLTERPREDKWIRKNAAASSPSSSPTRSGHGQPSWMELAKRKSMAWSDKTMD